MEGSEEILNFENRTIEITCLNVNWKKNVESQVDLDIILKMWYLCYAQKERRNVREVENNLEVMSENPQIGKR